MTCREFMDAAELLTPAELLRLQADDQPLSAHARECAACAKRVESHRMLGNALHALHSSTAQREAGPAVERAVLQAFRTQGFAPRLVVIPERTPPALWTLSRIFELGAYAAVAAALIVGLFLGSRILRDKQTQPQTSQAQTVSAPKPDEANTPVASESSQVPEQVAAKTVPASVVRGPVARTKQSPQAAARTESSTSDRAGYVALMLCDPLICSGEEQVIRMELSAGGAAADDSAAQPVVADVVIGEDGLVRAMRIVNQ